MPQVWNQVSIEDLEFIAESLKSASGMLSQAILAFREADIDTAWAPWTDATTAKVAALKSFARQTLTEVDDQVTAKRFHRKCRVEQEKERAARDTVTKQKKQKSTGVIAVKKPLGRPKKKA